MGKVLETRQAETAERFRQLQGDLSAAERIAARRACVYATGSFGRGEAGQHSDLDLFIVGLDDNGRPRLSRLDEICLKADLIEITQKLHIPDFSGDGEYLVHHTERALTETLGKPNDDANNTFTARLLLLLESRPLLEKGIYDRVISNVIAAYWRDYADHKSEFIPAFLANDILRLWRTFCVNYEARTSTEPKEKKAKRRLKNYKLKHSRLLTCFSGVLYLLAIYGDRKTVRPADAIRMTQLSPTMRLESLLSRQKYKAAHGTIVRLLRHYENFLATTDHTESELITQFLDSKKREEHLASANKLGDLTFEALEIIGRRSAFYRLLVV